LIHQTVSVAKFVVYHLSKHTIDFKGALLK
jgi:hypothetical protein